MLFRFPTYSSAAGNETIPDTVRVHKPGEEGCSQSALVLVAGKSRAYSG